MYHSSCPSAGYPTPKPQGCGCGSAPAPAPSYPMPSPMPTPIPAMQGTGYSQAIRVIAGAAMNALGELAAQLDPRGKVCGPWKPINGLTEQKLCCTPEIKRNGGTYGASLCVKITRPLDPFASSGALGFVAPYGDPTPG